MTDLGEVLKHWREAESRGVEYVLATITAVDGPSYRKPGASMILTADGCRAGTVSGGCLEAEVARRAFWLTEKGPALETYSTAPDDGDRPYGSGCGGTVTILLERRATADAQLQALQRAFDAREPLAIATVVSGPMQGVRAFAGTTEQAIVPQDELASAAKEAFTNRRSKKGRAMVQGETVEIWVSYREPRPGLWIFGAGDDARPLAKLAHELGWFVAVADGRSHLASRERFPEADQVSVLSRGTLRDDAQL